MEILTKALYKDKLTKSLVLQNLNLILFKRLLISVHIKKIEKIYDYLILQSICLIDTISMQKPKISSRKCKYTFGVKNFSFHCKVTLRKLKLTYFLIFFNSLVLSEMKRRHITYFSILDKTNKQIMFSVRNTNIFFKLDEFYFKWEYPIVFTLE